MRSIWDEPIAQLERLAERKGGTLTFRERRQGEGYIHPVVARCEWPNGPGVSGSEGAGPTPEDAASQVLFNLYYHKLVPMSEDEG